MPNIYNFSDAMISYSRKDEAFVKRLEKALVNNRKEVWLDRSDIRAGDDWWEEIKAGIEAADTFIFVISPDSLISEHCQLELQHAILHNKRIIPVLFRAISQSQIEGLPKIVQATQWINFTDERQLRLSYESLLTTLETGAEPYTIHKMLLVRAKDWMSRGQSSSLLLRGDDLKKAEEWLARSFDQQPYPVEIQIEYITKSRQAATRFQQFAFISIIVILLFGIGLILIAYRASLNAQEQTQFALLESQSRATQEQVAEDSIFKAATAEQNAYHSELAAFTAEARVVVAGTEAAQALEQSQNSATEVAIQATNAANFERLQQEAEALAQTAESNRAVAQDAQAQAEMEAEIAATNVAESLDLAESQGEIAGIAVQTADAAGTQAAIQGQNAAAAQATAAFAQGQANDAQATAAFAQSQANDAQAQQFLAETQAAQAQTQQDEAQNQLATATVQVSTAQAEAATAIAQATTAQGQVALLGMQQELLLNQVEMLAELASTNQAEATQSNQLVITAQAEAAEKSANADMAAVMFLLSQRGSLDSPEAIQTLGMEWINEFSGVVGPLIDQAMAAEAAVTVAFEELQVLQQTQTAVLAESNPTLSAQLTANAQEIINAQATLSVMEIEVADYAGLAATAQAQSTLTAQELATLLAQPTPDTAALEAELQAAQDQLSFFSGFGSVVALVLDANCWSAADPASYCASLESLYTALTSG